MTRNTDDIERALLGPGLGNREYGLLGTSQNLFLTPRQSSTLSAFILGARATTAASPGRYVAFFPLDGAGNDLWALINAESSAYGDGFVVFADALVMSRAYLEEINWAVHRIALTWAEMPKGSGGRVAAYTLPAGVFTADLRRVTPSAGIDASYFTNIVEERSGRPHVQAFDNLAPNAVLASLWEELTPHGRRDQSFCTNVSLAWRPADPQAAIFSVTVDHESAAPPAGAKPLVKFTAREGVVGDPRFRRAWSQPLQEFRRHFHASREVQIRAGHAETLALDADALLAFRAELRRAKTGNYPLALAVAAEAAATLRRQNALDEAHLTALGRAILREFEDSLSGANSDTVAAALDLYCARISRNLPEAPDGLAARLAIDSGALLLLATESIDAIAPSMLANRNFPAKAANVIEQARSADGASVSALARHLAQALKSESREEIVELAGELSTLIGRVWLAKPDQAAIGALFRAMASGGHIAELSGSVIAWTAAAKQDRQLVQWVGYNIDELVVQLKTASRARYPGSARAEWRRIDRLRLDLALNEAINLTSGATPKRR